MSEFVWADLSTYEPKKSRQFYEGVFGWQFRNAGGYWVAMDGRSEVAGLFETPDFFKKIKMPHFWMSYFSVDNADEAADRAGSIDGAIVELVDDFYGGRIALIRDPAGAGFTVYDGGKLDSRRLKAGSLVWNELHVSDAERVIPFYERALGWRVEGGGSPNHHRFFNDQQQHICDLAEISNDIKGDYEYWVCTFAVDDVGKTQQAIVNHGGGVVSDDGDRVMVHDDSGEAFFYIEAISSVGA